MSRIKDIARKNALRLRRKKRVRGKINGTVDKPRISVFKSNKYLYAQAINDIDNVTLASVDSRVMKLSVSKENAAKVGAQMAENLKAKNIENVVFDKNGYLYHGVVAAFAEALRENGIRV